MPGATSGALGSLMIPGLIVLIAVAFLIVIKVMSSRYKKIPPNSLGIFYGRRYKGPDGVKRGFRIVAGGGSLLWPIVEQLQYMSTAAFQTAIDENDIPNQNNVKISVKGVATCKMSTEEGDLYNAAMSFLGKTDEEIEFFVKNILIGHLRSIIGKLDIDQILRQRDTFNKRVIEESTEELKRLGIQVITLVIQEVSDVHGYIDALGQRTVAEAKRDAAIKVAEADAETRKKTSDAQKEAAIVVAANAIEIAKAEKDRDVQKAQFKVIADTETAKANQALAIATADQEKTLKVKQAERDAAEKAAQIMVQQKEAERRKAELEATVVRTAEAARQKAVIDADAAKSVALLAAEASSQAAIRRAEGDKQAAVLQGEGEASKTKAVLVAQAEGEAAKTRQSLLAQAEGEAARKGKVLIAEAEGTKQLAEALAKMTTDAKLILVLDRLPRLIELGGEAGEKVARAVFSSIAAPLGNIDSLHIVDYGGTGNGMRQLATLVPTVVSQALAAMKTSGVDVSELLKKAGIDVDAVYQMIGATSAGNKAAVPQATEPRATVPQATEPPAGAKRTSE